MNMEEAGNGGNNNNKGRFNGMESGGAKSKTSAGSGKNCDWFVRVMALVLSLTAALVGGLDTQTKVVPIKLVDSMPPLNVPVTAKWHYLSAYVYFVVANSIACAYAAVSLLLVLTNRVKNRAMGTLVTMLDAVMVGLLFSGCGAAAAVGVLGFQGNSHVRWDKVCNVFGKFCDQAAYSVAISMLASMAFLLLMVLPLLRLHPRNYLPTN